MSLPEAPELRAGMLQGEAPEDDLPSLLFSLRGRVSRRIYWLYGIVGPLLFQILSYGLLGVAGASETTAQGLSSALVIWPGIAISVKRWHDRDKSGWWVLINVIPVIGVLWSLLQCGLLRGTPGENRFGPDPQAAA